MSNSCRFWLFSFLLIVSACTGDVVFHQYLSVGEGGWKRNDTLDFIIPEASDTHELVADIGVRYARSYPYHSLWVVMERKFHEPEFSYRDTIEINLTDSNGLQLGKGNCILQREVPAIRFTMQKGQHGMLRLYHVMIREVVPGIRDMGLRVSVPVASDLHQSSGKQTGEL